MNNSYWLSSVEMGGYKTIKNVTVSFQQGLNIIIGKNGSSKTHFFEFLYNTLQMKFAGVSEFHANLELHYEGNEIKMELIEDKEEYEEDEDFEHDDNLEISVINNITFNKIETKRFVHWFGSIDEDIEDFWAAKGVNLFEIEKIDCEIPNNLPFLHTKGAISTTKQEVIAGGLGDVFIQYCERHKHDKKYDIAKIRADLAYEQAKFYEAGESIRKPLQKYTAIQDMRLHEGMAIAMKGRSVQMTNLIYEFQLNEEWLFFNDLPNGLKRVVWIISVIVFPHTKLVFLEEPELGIHPHQLNLLMKFLKEQSQEKQIILTTHAPQCLDILEADELSRIIVCEIEEKSTKLSHLDEKKQAKAKKYMEETDILSNYWRFSELEA